MTNSLLALVAGLALAALPLPAAADVPPPPNSPDAHCTLVEQCPHGEFCDFRWSPSEPGDGGAAQVGAECRKMEVAKGYERRCRDGGNYSGKELYCPPGEKGTWSPSGTATPSSTGCHLGSGRGGTLGLLALALVALAASGLLLRRRG